MSSIEKRNTWNYESNILKRKLQRRHRTGFECKGDSELISKSNLDLMRIYRKTRLEALMRDNWLGNLPKNQMLPNISIFLFFKILVPNRLCDTIPKQNFPISSQIYECQDAFTGPFRKRFLKRLNLNEFQTRKKFLSIM